MRGTSHETSGKSKLCRMSLLVVYMVFLVADMTCCPSFLPHFKKLRHRFAGALSTGLTPRSFSKRLLQIWGGSLVQAQEGSNVLNAVESQILSGPDLAMTRSEKQADQDASEDGHHESSDEDQPRGIEGKQTPTDAEEESDG